MPEAALQAAPVLPIILLAAWLPGWLAMRRLAMQSMILRPLEKQFAALTLGLAGLGWLAFLLAQLSIYSLPLLALLWLACTAALVAQAASLRTVPPALTTHNHLPELLIILLWLPLALWLFLRPHEAILGAADAGVYVTTAAHVARHGAILVHDPTLAAMDPALQAAVLRPIPGGGLTPAYLFPAYNVADAAAGAIIPDFFHFHSTWQAVAYSLGDLFGGTTAAVHAALLMPGLWALLGALAVYLTALRLFAPAAEAHPLLPTLFAALALAALSLTATQVWFARYPVAETLSQHLLWSGLWAYSAWLSQRRPLPLWGLLAALSFGLLLLTRIDMLFILALPALVAAWQIGQRALRRDHLWLYLPLALLALHAALHAAFISRPYFARVLGYGQQMLLRTWPILLVAIPVVLAAAWLVLRRGWRTRRVDFPSTAASAPSPASQRLPRLRRALLGALALLLLLLAAYAYFLRPVYGAVPSYAEWYDGQTIVLTDRENLLRLGWYLSPLGVWLAVAGAMLMIWRANRRTLPILLVGLFFSLLYLWRVQANPHQIYVMRRYVPAVVPFFIIAAAYLLLHLAHTPVRNARLDAYRRLRPTAALLIALAWLAATAYSARGFVTQADYRGLTAQLAQLDQALAPHSILLFDEQAPITTGDSLGAPLHFIFGHDVYSLRDPAIRDGDQLVKSIEGWYNNGRAVYWIGAPGWLDRHGWRYDAAQVTITTSALEGSYDHKPYQIIPYTWTLTLHRIQPP